MPAGAAYHAPRTNRCLLRRRPSFKAYDAAGAGPVPAEQLGTLVAILRSATGSGFLITLLFFSVGSLLFFYLFLRSRYIPRPLAALGLVGSAISLLAGIGGLVFPELGGAIQFGWGPIGVAEIATAFWLLLVGIRKAPRLSIP